MMFKAPSTPSLSTADPADEGLPPGRITPPDLRMRALGSRRFRLTRWSLVERVAYGGPEDARAALAELLQRYRAPLTHWIKEQLHLDDVQAEEAVHGYLGRAIEENLFAKADRERGRLRTFLCRSLWNDAVSRYRRTRSEVPLDPDGDAPPQSLAPAVERSFDRMWAQRLVTQAKAKVLAAHYSKDAAKALFEELVRWIESDSDGETAAEVGARLGKNANAVYQAAFVLKGHLRAQVRADVAETLIHRKDVDQEISALLAAMEEDDR